MNPTLAFIAGVAGAIRSLLPTHADAAEVHVLHGLNIPMGERAADLPGIFRELQSHQLKPLFRTEYERDFDHPLAQVIPSVKNFNEMCGQLLASQPEAPAARG